MTPSTARHRSDARGAVAGARVGVVVALVTWATAGCASSESATRDDGRPTVVATTSIWSDVVNNVACDDSVHVVTLIPAGSDPHSFEPSLQDRRTLDEADLVVANGDNLEESVADTLAAVVADGTARHDMIDGLATQETDPHIWFDPTLVAQALPALVDAIVAATDVERAPLEECADRYAASLATTDAQITDVLSVIPADRRYLVTSHDALGHFAARYDLTILGATIPAPSTLAEANPADLDELRRLVADAGVPAVFAESQHSSADLDALAAKVGRVEVVTLFTDSLGPQDSGASTYIDLLLTDARLIADALGAS